MTQQQYAKRLVELKRLILSESERVESLRKELEEASDSLIDLEEELKDMQWCITHPPVDLTDEELIHYNYSI